MNTNSIPKSFWIISIAALIWNLMGLSAFFMQVMMTPETLATLSSEEQALYNATPSWLNLVFGMAVIAGTLGCIALLLRKSMAIPILILSLIAVIFQNAYYLLLTDAMQVYGVTALIMPAMVIIIGAYLIYFARDAQSKAWIS